MPIVWIGFAIFMLLCEGFTTQLVSIWFVLGSVCAAITTIFTSDITIQSAVFLVVSLVSLIVTRPLVKRFKKRNKTTGTYHVTRSTGLHVKIPFIDKISKKVSLKEQVIDFPPQHGVNKTIPSCKS